MFLSRLQHIARHPNSACQGVPNWSPLDRLARIRSLPALHVGRICGLATIDWAVDGNGRIPAKASTLTGHLASLTTEDANSSVL